jgi:hypothetical protein
MVFPLEFTLELPGQFTFMMLCDTSSASEELAVNEIPYPSVFSCDTG